MGFKIINSREYREVCERVAFLESDLDEKNRELELKDEAIKRMKKEIVQLQDLLAKNKEELSKADELHGQARLEIAELRNQIAELTPCKAKPVIDFATEETDVMVEGEKEVFATQKKPRQQRKPRAKKDSK